ncbi:MAG: ABC transporter permease, partial [Gemmatimonadota bacterium]
AAAATDLRFALRTSARRPGTTVIAVLMLALGVAATTTVFSLVDALFLRPLPFPGAERLVYLDETAPRWNLEFTGVNYPDFHVWRENAEAFEAIGLFEQASYNLADDGGAERVPGLDVTHDLADALGIDPVVGRTFTAAEDRPGGPPVAMIGYDLWRQRFGADRSVVGRTLDVDGVRRTIVGVLPPEADFPSDVDLWVPIAAEPVAESESYRYQGVGRLRSGVTLEQARADIRRAHEAVWEERDTDRVVSPVVLPLRERLVGEARPIAIALGVAVGLVLLIACANVASVLLARSFARRGEMGVRRALGAGSGRLARQLFTESLAISALAGPLGLLLGFWAVRLLLRMLPEGLPAWVSISVDWRTGLFGLAVIVATALLFGWAPILQARRESVREALHGGGGGGGRAGSSRAQRRTMNLLVVAEVALSVLLLVGGGLLLRAFQHVRDVDPGFRTENVLHFRLELPEATYPESETRHAFYRALVSRLEALPGARAAGAITCPPLGGCHSGIFFEAEGRPRGPDDPNPVVLYRFATPGYFEAMGIRLARGRLFGELDGGGAGDETSAALEPGDRPDASGDPAGGGAADDGGPTVVVNESFARAFFPDLDDPVGRRIHTRGNAEGPLYTIVGVTRDVKHYGLDEPMRPGVYFPVVPETARRMLSLVVWTDVPPTSLVGSAREIVRELDPTLPLFGVQTVAALVDESLAARRMYSWLMVAFAALALALALGGIYGVVSYVVGQRRREIGLRIALGATPREVVGDVVRRGLILAAAGTGIGLLVAFAAGQALSGLLVGVSGRDLPTFAGAAALLALTALLATLAPARRAAAVDPQTVLREE